VHGRRCAGAHAATVARPKSTGRRHRRSAADTFRGDDPRWLRARPARRVESEFLADAIFCVESDLSVDFICRLYLDKIRNMLYVLLLTESLPARRCPSRARRARAV